MLLDNFINDTNKHIVWYSSCNIMIESKTGILKLLDFFLKDVQYFQQFINKSVLYFSKNDGDRNIYYGNSLNNALIITKNKIKSYMDPIYYNKSYFCKASYAFVNDIINNINPDELYDDYFLDILFNPNNIEKNTYSNYCKEYDECIIIPNIEKIAFLSKFNNIITKLKNTNKINILLSDINFTIIQKPNNYNKLKQEYLNIIDNNYREFKKKLANTQYSNIFNYISYVNNLEDNEYSYEYNKMNNIKKNFESYINTIFGINDCHLHITYSTYIKNFWLIYDGKVQDIYNGEYDTIKIVDYHSNILFDNILYCIKFKDNLDNQYLSSYKEYMLEYIFKSESLNIKNKYCLNDEYDITGKNKNTLINTKKSYDCITNNKFKNFKVLRILPIKLATTGAVCSYTLCGFSNDNYYLVTIYPNTLNQLKILETKKGYNSINNYIDNINKKAEKLYCYEDICFYLVENLKLFYKYEIIKLNCFDCEQFKRELSLCSSLEKEYKGFFDKEVVINVTENNLVLELINNEFRTNFKITYYALLINVIYNIYKYSVDYEKTNILINKFRNVLLGKIQDKTSYNFIYLDNLIPKTVDDIYNDINKTNNKDKNIIIHKNYPFICVKSEEYIICNTYRQIIWYIGIICDDIDKINIFIDKLANIENINEFINKDVYLDILRSLDININDHINNYLFNVYSMYNSDGSFKLYSQDVNGTSIKNVLDDFINYIKGDLYLYISYHYPSNIKYNILHIHIHDRYSKILYPTRLLESSCRRLAIYQGISIKKYFENNNYFNISKYMYFRHNAKLILRNNIQVDFDINQISNFDPNEIVNILNEYFVPFLYKDVLIHFSKLFYLNEYVDEHLVKNNINVLINTFKALKKSSDNE